MEKGLLIIRTLTPTHPGAGASVGAIDLMLQREVTTDFPFIQGSSLKGAIRSYLELQVVENKQLAKELIDFVNAEGDEGLKKEVENLTEDKLTIHKARKLVQGLKKLNKDIEKFRPLFKALETVFGPYESSDDFRKGSLIISDASLLFYPVRTLKGLYALVTCPEILRRLSMPHINFLPENSKNLLKWDDKEKVLPLGADIENFRIGDRVYFEDLNFGIDSNSVDISWINELPIENEDKSRIFLVNDDVFRYFVKFATQIVSRNKIDYSTGTVDKKIGGIWTEEHLPPETYLFSYLEDDKKKVGKIKVKNGEEEEVEKDATAFEWLNSKINSEVIHLGGDETVGKGFVELKVKNLNGGQ